MTATKNGAIVLPQDVETAQVLGIEVQILLDSEATGGAYALYRVLAEPQMGPPPHIHAAEDEGFTVVEGIFEVRLGAETMTLTAGATVFLPRGVPHAFKNVGDTTGILLGVATPGGHERFFREADRMAKDGSLFTEGELNIGAVVALCARNGMEVLPPGA